MRGIQQKWWNKEKSCRGMLKNTERERERWRAIWKNFGDTKESAKVFER